MKNWSIPTGHKPRCWCALVVAGALIGGAVAGCGKVKDELEAGSNSNWFRLCDDGASCGRGLECWCGVCTAVCSSDGSCEASSACIAPDSACGPSAIENACAIPCRTENDCLAALGSDAFCRAGICALPGALGSAGDQISADLREVAPDSAPAAMDPDLAPPPDDDTPPMEPVACSLVGCPVPLLLSILASNGMWLDGDYALSLSLNDGQTVDCTFQIPEATPDIAEFVSCSRTVQFMLGGGELSVWIDETPSNLAVVLSRDGTMLLDVSQAIAYREFYINDPRCGPACQRAEVISITFLQSRGDAGVP